MGITVVQTLPKTEGTSVASLQSAAFGSSPITGNTIIVLLWGYRNGSCTIAVNDNAGNTYTRDQDKADNSDPGIGYFNQIWRCTNITGGSGFKITASGAGSTSYFTFGAIEVSGLAANPVDQNTNDTNTGTAPDTGSITTTVPNELLVGVMMFEAAPDDTVTIPTNFTSAVQEPAGSGNFVRGDGSYRIVSSTLTTNPAWTLTASHTWSGTIVSYKAAAVVALGVPNQAFFPLPDLNAHWWQFQVKILLPTGAAPAPMKSFPAPDQRYDILPVNLSAWQPQRALVLPTAAAPTSYLAAPAQAFPAAADPGFSWWQPRQLAAITQALFVWANPPQQVRIDAAPDPHYWQPPRVLVLPTSTPPPAWKVQAPTPQGFDFAPDKFLWWPEQPGALLGVVLPPAPLPADAWEDKLAEAIAAELNDLSRPWAAYFAGESAIAVRTRSPWYQAADLATLKVAVVPLTIERTRIARNRRQFNYGIAIDLQRMVEPADTDRLEALSRVAEQIHDWFDDAHNLASYFDGPISVDMTGWICLQADRRDVYSLTQLYADRTWETLIALSVRGYRP